MSDYIMDLRKIVGHRPLLQVGASVIVEDEKGGFFCRKEVTTTIGDMRAVL